MKLLVAVAAVGAAVYVAYKVHKETKSVVAGATHEGLKEAMTQVATKLLLPDNTPKK